MRFQIVRIKSALVVLSLSLVCFVTCLVPRICLADTLTLVSTTGGSVDGVPVFPYDFTVTGPGGTTANVLLSCLNFNREISYGETWTVNVYNPQSIPTGSLNGYTKNQYLADALLFNQYAGAAGNSTLTGEIQYAIWSVMDPTDINASNSSYNGPGAFDSTSRSLASAALANASTAAASNFVNDLVFIPDLTNTTGWTNGTPQIFMNDQIPPAVTGEPTSLVLLGTGLIGGLVFIRRRQLKA
jgi:hypothetical protein